MKADPTPLPRVPTGIAGLDFVSSGGLPQGRPTLVAGTPGTGKTVLALQFLLHGAMEHGEPGTYVSFEESPADIRQTAASFGWPVEELESQGLWKFVDGAPRTDLPVVVTGAFDLSALLRRVEAAIDEISAKRVVLDAISTLFTYIPDTATVRWEMFRLRESLHRKGVTTLVTTERDRSEQQLTRHGVEAFVADNVLVLRNRFDGRQRQRTLAIAKMRAAEHQIGEFPFTISSMTGIELIPRSAMVLDVPPPSGRLGIGVPGLDDMLGGGLHEGSNLLVSGATGAGKTLLALHFLDQLGPEERGLFVSFEESRSEVLRDARGWGLSLPSAVEEGRVRLRCEYPEARSLEEYLIATKRDIAELQPRRVSIDALSALERLGDTRAFREFVLALVAHLKEQQITALFTVTAPASSSLDIATVADTDVSSIVDAVVLLRYLESPGLIRRVLAVLKQRGSAHDRRVREFEITEDGFEVADPVEVHASMLGRGPRNAT